MSIAKLQEKIVESIAIEAPIAVVYAALTTPEQLTQWWGDETHRATTMSADLRPGGAWKIAGTRGDGGPFSVSGIYRIVEAPSRLEFTWNHDWADESDPAALDETVVRYDLAERDGITHLTVTHSGFTSLEDRNDHARGWKSVLSWARAFAIARTN